MRFVKKKIEQFLETKTSYTKFGPPISCCLRLQAFSNYINDVWCMDLVFVDKLAKQNNGIKYLLIAVDVYFKISQSSNNEIKICQRYFACFQKVISQKQILDKIFLNKDSIIH